MVTGIILFALGVKESLIGESHELSGVAAVSLCGGVALYLRRPERVQAPELRLVQLPAPRRCEPCSWRSCRSPARLDAVVALALVAAVTAA